MPILTSANRLIRVLCRALPVVSALLVAGCTGLSQSQCTTGNWEDIGYKDGANGAPPERVAGHAEDCRAHGTQPDEAQWNKGYRRGIDEYCTPKHAVQIGERGSPYHGVCPAELNQQFETAWRSGRMVYDQRQRVEQLEQRRNQLDAAYRQAMDDNQRYQIRNELLQVDEWLRTERFRLAQAEAQLRQFERGIE